MERGIAYMAEAFGVPKEKVIETTTQNAFAFYGLEACAND
jgi:Tat protein secretion system quality control protein TatD with DNase activity